MFKKAKLYSLLTIIVISTVVGLFGFSQTASAQEDDNAAYWYADENGNKDENQIVHKGQIFIRIDNRDLQTFFKSNQDVTDNTQAASYFDPNNEEFKDKNLVAFVRVVPIVTDEPVSDQYDEHWAIPVIYFPDGIAEDATWIQFVSSCRAGDGRVSYLEGDESIIGTCGGLARNVVYRPHNKQSIPFNPDKASSEDLEDPTQLTDSLNPGDTETISPSCQIKGIGWLVCPVVTFLAEIADTSYYLLDKTLLKLQPIALPGSDSSQGMKLHDSWKMMRNFANVIFIMGFLVIVFSQITNVGVSNYGIKRLLPKIMIAAILVNLSYYICAFAVDISNILGNLLREAISPDGGALLKFEGEYEGVSFDSTGFTGITGFIVGGLATAGIVYAFLPFFLPMVVTAAVAVMTVVIALTLRQALIVILIIISPLAFVALLLPNTESYFQKWKSLFIAMLLVYPIISVVFGASALASNILMTSTDDFWTQMVGAGVSIIPLFLTPIIMKVSGGLLNRWVGMVNDPSKGWVDSKRNALDEQGKIIAARRRAGSVGRVGDWVSSTNNSRLFGGANSRRRQILSFGTAYGEKTRKDNLEAAESGVENAYLGTQSGQQTRNDAKNAQIRLQNAQLDAETVRIGGVEGQQLQRDTTVAELRKHTAEARSQTIAIGAIPHALGAAAKEAEMEKKAAENREETAATGATAGGVADRTLRRSELELEAAKTGSDANWAGQTITDPALRNLTQEVQRNQTAINGVAQGVSGRRFNTDLASGAVDIGAALGVAVTPGDEISQAVVIATSEAAQKEVQRAAQPLRQELAQATPEQRDDILRLRARDPAANEFQREAALQEAAQRGRDGVLRDLRDTSTNLVTFVDPFTGVATTNTAAAFNTSVNQTSVEQAIASNSGALANKAPDLVKGRGAAFNTVSGNDLVAFSNSTMAEYIRHIESELIAGRNEAAESLLSAVEDIVASSDLQGRFESDRGRTFATMVGASPILGVDPNVSLAAAAVQPDGKIR